VRGDPTRWRRGRAPCAPSTASQSRRCRQGDNARPHRIGKPRHAPRMTDLTVNSLTSVLFTLYYSHKTKFTSHTHLSLRPIPHFQLRTSIFLTASFKLDTTIFLERFPLERERLFFLPRSPAGARPRAPPPVAVPLSLRAPTTPYSRARLTGLGP